MNYWTRRSFFTPFSELLFASAYDAVNDFLLNFGLGIFQDCVGEGSWYTRNSGSLGGKSAGAFCACWACDALPLDLFWNVMSQIYAIISLALWKIALQCGQKSFKKGRV